MLRDTLVPELRRFFAEPDHQVAVAHLFGSVARGQAFRNIVVHRYLQVDVAIGQRIVTRDLDDPLAFVRAIRARLPADDATGGAPGSP